MRRYLRTACGVDDGFVLRVEPDPDIAGIGIIMSFVVIGSTVMALALCQIWRDEWGFFKLSHLVWPPEKPDASEEDEDGLEEPEEALGGTLFGLADTQYATGIAICAAALTKSDITVYHYALCCEMGWLAFICSTMGLLTIRCDLMAASGIFKRAFRLVLMWVHLGLLLAVEAQRNDDLAWAEKVYEHNPRWDVSTWRGRLVLVLIMLSFFSAIVDAAAFVPGWGKRMYYGGGAWVRACFRHLGSFAANWRSFITGEDTLIATEDTLIITEDTGMWRILAFPRVFGGIVPFLGGVLFLSAGCLVSLSLYWFLLYPITVYFSNLAFFLWGTHDLFYYRGKGQACMKESERGKEDSLGFGQIVALTLLISPIISNADLWFASLKNALNADKEEAKPGTSVGSSL